MMGYVQAVFQNWDKGLNYNRQKLPSKNFI